MPMFCPLILLMLLLRTIVGKEKTLVWIDCDNSAGLEGVRDIDDGLALIQSMHSDELNILGISTVFGNAAEPDTYMATKEMLETLYGSKAPPTFSGAGHAGDFLAMSEAVEAMANFFNTSEQKVSILALGALTNIAAFIKQYQMLTDRIERIVFVGGRRPRQEFKVGTVNLDVLPDLNVEKDAEAVRIILYSGIPLILTPFELSSQIHFTEQNFIQKVKKEFSPVSQYILKITQPWLEFWHDIFSVNYFNPYDSLAVLALTHPAFLSCDYEAIAALVYAPSDNVSMAFDSSHGLNSEELKPYLIVHTTKFEQFDDTKKKDGTLWVPITYCHTPRHPHAAAIILARLLGNADRWPKNSPRWSSSRHPPHITPHYDGTELRRR